MQTHFISSHDETPKVTRDDWERREATAVFLALARIKSTAAKPRLDYRHAIHRQSEYDVAPMFTSFEHFTDLMSRGGYIMWPLLLLSLVSMTLAFERCWFWLRTNWPGREQWIAQVSRAMRQGDIAGAKALAETDRTLYGSIVKELLAETYSDALATDVVGSQRSRIDRFMPTLSTIITAAPMLGILGTVMGIISSFQVLSAQTTATDPSLVSQGIAEALLTTVAGLVVALFTLFFFSAFSAQVDRTLSRLETLIAAAARASFVKAEKSAIAQPSTTNPEIKSAP